MKCKKTFDLVTPIYLDIQKLSFNASQPMDPKAFKQLLKTTPKFINILAENGIHAPKDLLWYFPRTYEDRRDIKPISLLKFDGSTEITKGKVIKKSLIRTPRGKKLATIEFIDEQDNK